MTRTLPALYFSARRSEDDDTVTPLAHLEARRLHADVLVRNVSVSAKLRLERISVDNLQACQADCSELWATVVQSQWIHEEATEESDAKGSGADEDVVGKDVLTVAYSYYDRSAPDYCGWDTESRIALGGVTVVLSAPLISSLRAWAALAAHDSDAGDMGASEELSGVSSMRLATFGKGYRGESEHLWGRSSRSCEDQPLTRKADVTVQSLQFVLVSVDEQQCRAIGGLDARLPGCIVFWCCMLMLHVCVPDVGGTRTLLGEHARARCLGCGRGRCACECVRLGRVNGDKVSERSGGEEERKRKCAQGRGETCACVRK